MKFYFHSNPVDRSVLGGLLVPHVDRYLSLNYLPSTLDPTLPRTSICLIQDRMLTGLNIISDPNKGTRSGTRKLLIMSQRRTYFVIVSFDLNLPVSYSSRRLPSSPTVLLLTTWDSSPLRVQSPSPPSLVKSPFDGRVLRQEVGNLGNMNE